MCDFDCITAALLEVSNIGWDNTHLIHIKYILIGSKLYRIIKFYFHIVFTHWILFHTPQTHYDMMKFEYTFRTLSCCPQGTFVTMRYEIEMFEKSLIMNTLIRNFYIYQCTNKTLFHTHTTVYYLKCYREWVTSIYKA